MTGMRWPLVPLGEVAPLVRRPLVVEPEGKYREIGIRSHGKGVFHKLPVSGLELGDKRVYRICPGDLLFNIVFAWEGAVALAGVGEEGMIGSHRFLTCVVDRERADASFLRHFFTTPTGLAHLLASSPGGAGRNRTLGLAGLSRIPVPLPPLDDQRRIVARLDAVSARLKACAETTERQEAELAAMLQQAFARITAGSPRARMADVAPLVRRPIEVEPDGQYPELGIRSFGRGPFHKPSLSGLDAGSKRLFRIEPGDLVFNIVFAWEGAVAIARPEDAGRVGSHRFLTCVADQTRVSAEILRFWFLSREGLAALGQASPGGAGRNRTLGLDALSRIEVPIPSLDAQAWFEALHARASNLRALHAAAADDAAALVPAMLHQTFSPAAC
ncbi:hypothetical protein KPL78_28390 [Roseomonas sp. HJA6]|uniref:Restriction endonuclease subunit S n=1 Tax=Roseomonas alba TaxID=2846776 RepID=A0ABS7AHL7_9PROT|nr:hypothetical protein [Neoroseomonas alba]MBW6401800.1 hypothetical protein [Neoroseomonas alba]